MAEIKIADGGSLKRFRKWIQSKYYTKDDTFTKAEVNTKIDSIAFKQASSTEAGIAKLYSALGQNTDGAPTNKAVQDAVNEVMKTLYPVGSIYLSFVKQDPGTWIAGTRWSLVDSGYALWTTTANDAGSPIPAGLPNIKGSFVISTAIEGTTNPPAKDAFSRYIPSQTYGTGLAEGSYWNKEGLGTITWGFDAGKYNSAIYKDSNDTVQPPAMKIYAYRRMPDSDS